MSRKLNIKDAILAQDACNPSGIAHSIAGHFSAMIADGADTETLKTDLPARLMVAKLADLLRLDVSNYGDVYGDAVAIDSGSK